MSQCYLLHKVSNLLIVSTIRLPRTDKCHNCQSSKNFTGMKTKVIKPRDGAQNNLGGMGMYTNNDNVPVNDDVQYSNLIHSRKAGAFPEFCSTPSQKFVHRWQSHGGKGTDSTFQVSSLHWPRVPFQTCQTPALNLSVMLNTKKKALDGPHCNYKVSGKLWLIPVWSAPRDKFNTNNTLIKSLTHTKHMKILVIGI